MTGQQQIEQRAQILKQMGEPGGLLSTGSHRIGHDRRDLAAAAALKSHKPHHLQAEFSLEKIINILLLLAMRRIFIHGIAFCF